MYEETEAEPVSRGTWKQNTGLIKTKVRHSFCCSDGFCAVRKVYIVLAMNITCRIPSAKYIGLSSLALPFSPPYVPLPFLGGCVGSELKKERQSHSQGTIYSGEDRITLCLSTGW